MRKALTRIQPSYSSVIAEIYREHKHDILGKENTTEILILTKTFNKKFSFFNSGTPEEYQYIAAEKWIKEQMLLIDKYCDYE